MQHLEKLILAQEALQIAGTALCVKAKGLVRQYEMSLEDGATPDYQFRYRRLGRLRFYILASVTRLDLSVRFLYDELKRKNKK